MIVVPEARLPIIFMSAWMHCKCLLKILHIFFFFHLSCLLVFHFDNSFIFITILRDVYSIKRCWLEFLRIEFLTIWQNEVYIFMNCPWKKNKDSSFFLSPMRTFIFPNWHLLFLFFPHWNPLSKLLLHKKSWWTRQKKKERERITEQQ